MNSKLGITVSSLVIYVILLFSFTAVALGVSGNFTSGIYNDKGLAINLSNLDKIQYYLNKSAVNSTSVEFTSNSITFSNGNEYTYDAATRVVYYNKGILVTDVTKFIVTNNEGSLYEIQMEFTKYSVVTERIVKINVGE